MFRDICKDDKRNNSLKIEFLTLTVGNGAGFLCGGSSEGEPVGRTECPLVGGGFVGMSEGIDDGLPVIGLTEGVTICSFVVENEPVDDNDGSCAGGVWLNDGRNAGFESETGLCVAD